MSLPWIASACGIIHNRDSMANNTAGNMANSLRIEQIRLTNLGRFNDLHLSFGSQTTVICGANGVGKTSILDAIAASVISFNTNAYLRKKANSTVNGKISATFNLFGDTQPVSGEIDTFYPDEKFSGYGLREAAKYLIYLRAARDFNYSRKDSVKRDIVISEFQYQSRAFEGVDANEIKDWFANRYLMRPHGEDWPVYRKENLEVAKNLFSLLDSSVKLNNVDTSSFDINVETPSGVIPYEYLSSGFRSAFSMLLGIIKEIEYRRIDLSASEFDGVILIDEVDLHLHPTWQLKILFALKETFKSAQIIVSTHSPHVVQSASTGEVVALLVNGGGEVFPERFPHSEYGFVGWSIEEILSDVMGVGETTSTIYRQTVSDFESAITEENEPLVNHFYEKLCDMLHPRSPLRKVFFLQAAQFINPNHKSISQLSAFDD